jgi:hypothetical protein
MYEKYEMIWNGRGQIEVLPQNVIGGIEENHENFRQVRIEFLPNRSQIGLHIVKSKSESHYDRRPVGQSVLVSSPIRGPRPDFCYCQTFAVLSTGLSFVAGIVSGMELEW